MIDISSPHSDKFSLWESSHWKDALTDFSKASLMTVSLYDSTKTRKFGPYNHNLLNQIIQDTGAWASGKPCGEAEMLIVEDALRTGETVHHYFKDTLLFCAIPVRFRGNLAGVVVFGWTFEEFPEPVRSAKLSRIFDISENYFWATARMTPPMSRERFEVYTNLLKSLVESIVSQLSTVLELKDADQFKDRFIATISHELRTPISAMKMRVQLFRKLGAGTPEEFSTALALLERSVSNQERLVEDLLEASRAATGKLRIEKDEINPVEILRTSIDDLQSAAKNKDIAVEFNEVKLSELYIGDFERIQQVFYNLLNNSIKFTPNFGQISVSFDENSKRLRIEIKDTGMGIDSEKILRIFEPFHQLTEGQLRDNKGLGLGLSIAKSIIELHGGSLEVRSDGIGRGSVFSVILPSASVH